MALTRITKGVIKPNENYDTHNINSTGIITATALDISGNASIAGVLTYEDVTSIDSVGIITAQNGLHVLNGYVGIGTAFPGEALDINSKTNSRAIRVYSEGSSSTSKLVLRTGDNGTSKIHFGDTSDIDTGEIRYRNNGDIMSFHVDANSERLTLDSDRLIIGENLSNNQPTYNSSTTLVTTHTNNPGAWNAIAIISGNTTGASFLKFGDRDDEDVSQIGHYNDDNSLRFYTNGANERLRISSDGKVSIGTQNVDQGVLQVNGDITAKLRHGSSDMYGMLAGRKFDGTSAMGGYAIRYASGYESPWIVGYNAGSSYNNQITFGSMTTSDRSLETGVQKRMVIDMASGKVGISSDTPAERFDVAGSINAGGETAPVLKIHNEQGNYVHAFKHYFDVFKGAGSGTSITRTIVAITINENFHQAIFEITYGTRLQAVSDAHVRPNKIIFGVNRFNSGNSVNVTKTIVEQHSEAATHCDANIVTISTSPFVYHLRLDFSSTPNVSSGAGGWVEACNIIGATFHDVNVYYGVRD